MKKEKRLASKISLGIIILLISVFAVPGGGDKSAEGDHSAVLNQQERGVFDTDPPAGTDRRGGRSSSGYWSAVETVSTESDMGGAWGVVAVDAVNTLHVVWEDETDYNGCGIDFDIFYKNKPYGGTWSVTEVVSTESSVNSGYSQLAVDSDGAVHVTWFDYSEAEYNVYYKKKPFGGNWTTTELVSTEAEIASLAVGEDKAVHIAYWDPTAQDIYYKKKPFGGSWSAAEVVNTESRGLSDFPSLALAPNNTVHIAWSDYTDYNGAGGSDLDIFYKKKYVIGGWTTTEVVSTESDLHSYIPDLVVDSDETAHVVWSDTDNNNIELCYKNKPVSDTWSTQEYVATLGPNAWGTKSLAAGDHGTVHFVWDDEIEYGPGGGINDLTILYRKRFSGGSWTTIEEVSEDSPYPSGYPSAAVDSRGIVHVVWTDHTDDYHGSGSDWDIFYRKKIPADVIHVDDDNTLGPWEGTIDYPFENIQDGIDAAVDGMTVLIADGTYQGAGNQDLRFDGKAITLRSENGPYACVIDIFSSSSLGFYFSSNEGPDSVLMGFTIQNGHPHHALDGAAIYCEWASPTIINNIFRDNDTSGDGGAIACYDSYPLIKNNLFIGNSAYRGGAIYCYFVAPTLINNTIVGNSAVSEGGGIFVDNCILDVDIVNTILWGNTAPSGAQIGEDGGPFVDITYSDIQGGFSGTGNIDADPIFVSGPLGGYYLSQIAAGQASNSPCVDAGYGTMPWPCLSDPSIYTICGTTRNDIEPDLGIIDMGYHYPFEGIQIPPGHQFRGVPGDEAKFQEME